MSVVFYYAYLQVGPPAPPQPKFIPQATHTLVHTDITAKSVLPRAKSKIAMWQEDAQLYAISATWEEITLDTVGQAAPWVYRYYSPRQKRIYFVTVNPTNGEIIGTSHGERVYNAPQPIPIEEWTIDSAEALNVWLNQGGAAMLTATPKMYVLVQLHVRVPDAPLAWTVAGFDEVSGNYHTVFVHATTGEVIDIKSSLY